MNKNMLIFDTEKTIENFSLNLINIEVCLLLLRFAIFITIIFIRVYTYKVKMALLYDHSRVCPVYSNLSF